MHENLLPIVILAILILLSAYFSATETAFSSLNKTRLKTLAEKGNRRAKLANRLHDRYDKLISTILIGNNIVNIATASIGTVLFVRLCGEIGATISTVVITVLVLIFGEITPKSIAKDCPEQFAMFSAPFIHLLGFLLTPLNALFSLWKKFISKLFKIKGDAKMSQEELLMLVDEVEQDGSINEEEGSLLRNVIEFPELRAEHILTHRVDLEAVNITDSKEDIARTFTETKFSRLPVYEESIDNIVGVIHQKDFYEGTGISDKALSDLMTAPIFVLKSEKLNELLRLLQENKSHVAVVLDEYGGTLGIVTLEDILEELVGEIWDEHDEVTEEYQDLGENTWLIDPNVTLDDFNSRFDITLDSECVSLGGWVMECFGHIPEEGETYTHRDLTVRVVALDGQRITKIAVILHPCEKDTEEQDVEAA